ncbi:hypothetical protein D3C81_1918420 [compost metagenome]
MQALLQREKALPPGMQPGEQQRAFIGLRAAVYKERPAQLAGQYPRQPFRQFDVRLGQIDRAGMLQRSKLLCSPFHDLRITMPAGHHGNAGKKIGITRTVMTV